MIYSDAAPHIWSLSRKFRRNFCPRSAILRYREAPAVKNGEYSADGDRIYACSKRISDSKFLREILLGVMQQEFYTGETDAELLTGAVMETFFNEYRNLIWGKSSRQLLSLCGRELDFEEKGRELEHRMYAFLANIRPHWEKLLTVPPEARKTIARVLDLQISEYRCFGSPLCAYFESGKLCFVELRGGDFIGSEAETALLHCFYAMNHCGCEPDKVGSLVLDHQNGTFRTFFSGSDLSEAIRAVKNELAAWEELWQQRWQNIPGNEANCPYCAFAPLCRDSGI